MIALLIIGKEPNLIFRLLVFSLALMNRRDFVSL
jgi:hypothetical protein